MCKLVTFRALSMVFFLHYPVVFITIAPFLPQLRTREGLPSSPAEWRLREVCARAGGCSPLAQRERLLAGVPKKAFSTSMFAWVFFLQLIQFVWFFVFFFQFLLQLCFILFMWRVYFFGQIPAVLACHFSPCFFDNYLYIQCLQNPTSLALSSPKFMPFCVFCWITFFFGVFFSGFQFSRFFSP